MTSITTGSAQMWGVLWGARADDWATLEEQQLPTYTRALHHLGIGSDDERVLEIGCGSGVFLHAAADRGARVAGIDASEPLLAIARERVPEADLRVGDMEALPFGDDAFDVVTGFSSFFFAEDMSRALREAARVTKPRGTVLIQVFGRPERCTLEAVKRAVLPFLALEADEPPYWRFDMLEELAREAGLTPIEAFDATWAYDFEDEDALLTAMLSAGSAVAAVGQAGREPVAAAILDAVAPWRADDGSYRLENEWHYLVAQIR
jgi:SAM-dependent methyltransferase